MKLCGFEAGLDKPLFVMRGASVEGGAGIGATWSRGPLAGCDRGADQGASSTVADPCASPGSDPRGSLFRPSTRPYLHGDATPERRGPAVNQEYSL
jgi:hypothetical protein